MTKMCCRTRRLALVSLVLVLAACSGPEAKKAKFLAKGKALYEKGDYQKALLELKNATQIDPKLEEAYRYMGLCEMKQTKLKEAFGLFQKAVQLKPDDLDAHYQLGKIYLAAGALQQSRQEVDLILAKNPRHEAGQLLQGALLIAANDISGAISLLEGMLAAGSTNRETYQLLATAHLKKNDPAGARNILQLGLSRNPRSVALIISLANLTRNAGSFNETVGLLRRAIELEPNEPEHTLRLADYYWQVGQQITAAAVLEEFIHAAPKDEGRRLQVANFYAARNEVQHVEGELKEGLKENPKSAQMRLALAEFYAKTAHPDQSMAALKEIVDQKLGKKPEAARAKLALVQLYLATHDLDRAALLADEVIADSPHNQEAHFAKGSICMLKGEGGKAVAEFRTVVSDNPQSVSAQLRLAEAHLANKEPNLALDVLKTALKTTPDSRDLQRGVARVLRSQKDYAQAQEVLSRLLAKNPADLEVVSDLGDLYLQKGDVKGAERQYAELKAKAPKVPVGSLKLSELYLKEGKKDQALREAEQAYRLGSKSWMVVSQVAAVKGEGARSTGDLDSAVALARQALALKPDEPGAQETLGWLSYRKGEYSAAVDLLGKVQKAAPGAGRVNYRLGMAQYKAGQRAAAKESLRRSLAGGDFVGREEAERTLRTL